MNARLGCLIVVATVAALGLLPASNALASTIDGPGIPELEAGNGEINHVTITAAGGNLVVTDTAGITTTTCTQDNPNQVTCTAPTNGNSHIRVNLGDMDDELTFDSPTPQKAGLIVSGGAGNDHIDLSGLAPVDADTITAQIEGDAGDDTMIGSQGTNFYDFYCIGPFDPCPEYDAGNDTMLGGPENDWMRGGRGADFLDGRGGVDILEGVVTDQTNPGDLNTQSKSFDDNTVDTILCGTNAFHGVSDPSKYYDSVYAGVGDGVGIDCEQIQQQVLCPPTGALCDGTPLISTTTTAAAAGSAATTSRKRRRKVVLGRAAENIRLKGGKTTTVFIELRKKRVRRALGTRNKMTVTFHQNFDRVRNGHEIGRADRRKRFKMRRP